MTITEFILARIEEDEESAFAEYVATAGPRPRTLEDWASIAQDDRAPGREYAQRILDAHSKRRTLEQAVPDALHDLAAVYAGHPSYKPEWGA